MREPGISKEDGDILLSSSCATAYSFMEGNIRDISLKQSDTRQG